MLIVYLSISVLMKIISKVFLLSEEYDLYPIATTINDGLLRTDSKGVSFILFEILMKLLYMIRWILSVCILVMNASRVK